MNDDRIARGQPPHLTWNAAMIAVDYVSCSVGMTFMSVGTILPAFVNHLTDSLPVIGLVSTIYSGCSLLPQLAMARWIGGKQRKKPYLMAGIASSRIFIWIIAGALWAGLSQRPGAMLLLFFLCLGLFAAGDGSGSLAGIDILARAIPLKRRGRLLGAAQFVSAIGGVATGATLNRLLDHQPFPTSYRSAFTLASLAFVPSLVALALIREPPPDSTAEKDAGQPSADRLPRTLFNDRRFRLLMVCRLLIGMMALAAPFYAVYPRQVLGLPESVLGSYVIAQTVAAAAASPILGFISDRYGPCQVMSITAACAVLAPLLALSASIVPPNLNLPVYLSASVFLGLATSSGLMGHLNYLLEIAPASLRPLYVGISNTLQGMMVFAPIAGGWLLERTSYRALFTVTALVVATGFVVTLRLPPLPVQDQCAG